MKEVLITSSVLIAALLLLRVIFRRSIPRRAQYALWALVLVRLLVPVSLPAAPFSVLSSAPRVQTAVTASMARPIYVLPVDIAPADHYPNAEKTAPGGSVPTAQSFGYPVLSGDGQTVTTYAQKLSVGEVLTRVWLVGAALMTCFFLYTNLRFWLRLRKDRKAYPVEGCKRPVYLCDALPSPCLFGLFRPAIYLIPGAASPENLRHVLAHEETHAKHLDPLWSLLRCICLATYWFDPFVWAAAWASKADCELACDEGALLRLGEAERIPYGETLLSLIPVRRGPSNPLLAATTMTSGKRQLKDRIGRIAQRPKTAVLALAAVAVLALAVGICTFTGATKPASPLPGREPVLTIPLTGPPVCENPHSYQGLTRLDLNGDGADEYVAERALYFARDGKVYEVDLPALLQAAWPEMTRWNSSVWDPYGKYLTIHGQMTVPGWGEAHAAFTRYLYLGERALLIYKDGETADHVLEGVMAPDEVLLAAKKKALAAYEAIKAEAPDVLKDQNFDDWRVSSLDRVDLQMYGVKRPQGDIEVYSTNYDCHSATPWSVICAGGSSVDEDGWYSGFYVRESPYLVFQVKDGTRVQLESALPGWDCTAPEFQDGFYETLLQNGLISEGDAPLIPEGAAQFEARLRDWIIPQYGGLAEEEAFTLDYQSNPPQIDDLDCWAFDAYRGNKVTGFGSEECLGRYYADKTTGQVYHHKSPDWFLATIPNSYVFPKTISSETVQNDILHHVRKQLPAGGFEYGRPTVFLPEELTLVADYPDMGASRGYDGTGVYYCPVRVPEVSDWTDPTPYLVFSPTQGFGGGYYCIGALSEADAKSEAAVQALLDAWYDVNTNINYLNFRTGNDAYDAATGYYTNDTYHFTWQLPEGVYNNILFRDTGRGVGVYYRAAYERYVARHGGVDDGGLSDPLACGRLFEVLAGPKPSVLTDADWNMLNILPMCQNDGDSLHPLPAPNGWYYGFYMQPDWEPDSLLLQDYRQLQSVLLESYGGVNPV